MALFSRSLFVFLIFLIFSFYASKAYAIDCTASPSYIEFGKDTVDLKFYIQGNDALTPGGAYYVNINSPDTNDNVLDSGSVNAFAASDGKSIEFPALNGRSGTSNMDFESNATFYLMTKQSNEHVCKVNMPVFKDSCTITVTNDPKTQLTTKDFINVIAKFKDTTDSGEGKPSKEHRLRIFEHLANGGQSEIVNYPHAVTSSDLDVLKKPTGITINDNQYQNGNAHLDQSNAGDYYFVAMQSGYSNGNGFIDEGPEICYSQQFTIGNTTDGGGIIPGTGGTSCTVCNSDSTWQLKDGVYKCVKTADGSDGTSTQQICPPGTICNPSHLDDPKDKAPICQGSTFTDPSSTDNPAPLQCSETNKKDGTCKAIDSGLGIQLPTEIGAFVNTILGVVLSISGGIATILIIISGYRLMVSQGNPEKIQAAREELTAAIVGLLFVIFSLVILTVIGFNILGLSGFS